MPFRWMGLGLGVLLWTGCTPSGGGGGDGDAAPNPLDAASADAGVADATPPDAGLPHNTWTAVPGVSARTVAVDGDGVVWIGGDGVWRHDGQRLEPVPFDPTIDAPTVLGLDVTVSPPLAAGSDGEGAQVYALRDGQWVITAVDGRRFDAAAVGQFAAVRGRGPDLFALAPGQGLYEYDADAVLGDPVFSNINSGAGGSLTTQAAAIRALYAGQGVVVVGTSGLGMHWFCDQGGRGGGAWCIDAVDPLDDWNPNYPRQSTSRVVQIGDAVIAAGSSPPLMERAAPFAAPFAVADWLPIDAPALDGRTLWDVAGLEPTALWVVGPQALVARSDGADWITLDPGAGEVDYAAIAVRPDPAGVDVWLVASNGLLLRCQGACNQTAAPCTDAACVNLPEAGFGEACSEPGGQSNCAEGLVCTGRSLCAECEADEHCGEGRTCAFGECRDAPAAQFGEPCTGGPGEQAECTAGLMCNEEMFCVVCRTTQDCPANSQCAAGRCEGGRQHGDDCVETGQCMLGLICTQRGICGECDTDADCHGGTCNGFSLCEPG